MIAHALTIQGFVNIDIWDTFDYFSVSYIFIYRADYSLGAVVGFKYNSLGAIVGFKYNSLGAIVGLKYNSLGAVVGFKYNSDERYDKK